MKIQFNIPSTKQEYVRIWEVLKFKLFGFRCSCCNKRLFYRNPEYTAFVHNKQFIGHTWGRNKKTICNNCLAKDLVQRNVFEKDEHKCYWCEQKKPVTSWFNRNSVDEDFHFTFGSGWWNGHHICKDCITEALTNIKSAKSNMSVYDEKTKKSYYVNELGVMDKRNNVY